MVTTSQQVKMKIERLTKLINIQVKIRDRYEKIRDWLDGFLKDIENKDLFLPEVYLTKGKHKYHRGYDIERNEKIRPRILRIERGLEIILSHIKWVDKIDMMIEEEQVGVTGEQIKEDRMKRIDVEFDELRKLLEKFDNILKKIVTLEKRKGIITEISAGLRRCMGIIENDPGSLFEDENKKEIRKIRDDLLKLERINESLLHSIEKEYKLEEKEEELLRVLVRGLKRDHIRFAKIVNRYKLSNVHQFMDGLVHFETNLNSKEQEIIIYEVTPVILRLHKLTGDFINLIKGENDKIKSFRDFVKRIARVQAGKGKIKEKDRTLALQILDSIRELENIIKNKEGPLLKTITGLQKEIEKTFKKLIGIEYKREGISKKSKEVPKLQEEGSAELGPKKSRLDEFLRRWRFK